MFKKIKRQYIYTAKPPKAPSTLANEVCARTAFGVEAYGGAVSTLVARTTFGVEAYGGAVCRRLL